MAASVPTSRSDGRSERRIPQKLTAELSHPDESLPKERAFTENVSPHGARVTTGRPWQPGSPVLIMTSCLKEGSFTANAWRAVSSVLG
jgi:hypothetical protein